MTPADVSKLVQAQIGGCKSLPNSHGIDLGKCLTKPVEINVIHRRVIKKGKVDDTLVNVWLVLEENPCERDGYKIVFDEHQGMFGLASCGFASDRYPVLCGYYGDFPTTLASM